MSSQPPILKVTHLTKRFDTTAALVNLTFKIKPKQIVALLGHNGSGKTTLLKTLVGLYAPSKGSIQINGKNLQRYPTATKIDIGYVPDKPDGFDYLTGMELLKLTASLKKTPFATARAHFDEHLAPLGLESVLDQRLIHYSRGNKQKVAFLAALIGQPKILFIDEPIVGLDPQSIETFGTIIQNFAKNGGAVLYATHILEFGQKYANQVMILSNGKLAHHGKISGQTSLAKLYQTHVVET